ncbi:hypothetical protein GINT2_000479 [Glugoides intestinalis]
MERTKEFNAIVELTEIKQFKYEEIPFYTNIKQLETDIEQAFTSLSKLTSYETFKAQSHSRIVKELLDRYKRTEISSENGTRDYNEVISNLKAMVNTKFLKYTLKLNELNRRFRSEACLETANNIQKTSTDKLMLQEEQERHHQDEFIEERKRIVKSINEIGQMVEDISIHVSLQEEQLKRIDDIIVKSDGWSKKALWELNDIWNMACTSRKTIIKFFAFWTIILLFFWLLRKI